jgi:hypothetical protein
MLHFLEGQLPRPGTGKWWGSGRRAVKRGIRPLAACRPERAPTATAGAGRGLLPRVVRARDETGLAVLGQGSWIVRRRGSCYTPTAIAVGGRRQLRQFGRRAERRYGDDRADSVTLRMHGSLIDCGTLGKRGSLEPLATRRLTPTYRASRGKPPKREGGTIASASSIVRRPPIAAKPAFVFWSP